MKWEDIKSYKAPVFKRLTGVSKETFSVMISEATRLDPASLHKIQGSKRGPKPKLSIEDKLLMMLMYYREYRTFLHISSDYGISEAQCWRIFKKNFFDVNVFEIWLSSIKVSKCEFNEQLIGPCMLNMLKKLL